MDLGLDFESADKSALRLDLCPCDPAMTETVDAWAPRPGDEGRSRHLPALYPEDYGADGSSSGRISAHG